MKRGVLLVFLLSISLVLADWNPDINEDGCIDQTDLDLVGQHLNAQGTSEYDVDQNGYVNERDLEIVQSYLDRGDVKPDCDGFKCIPEECNTEDDDCDGKVDEDSDEDMCGDKTCISGKCAIMAGDCRDSDGFDIFTQGTSIGKTLEGGTINQKESCYDVDIYRNVKKTNECYGKECYVTEYECAEPDTIKEEKIYCKYGCRYGRCRKITKKCIETDEGLDIFNKSSGTIEKNGSLIALNDVCIDQERLLEYECTEEFNITTKTLNEDYVTFEIPCKCSDGVCTNVPPGDCVDTDGNDKYTKGLTYGVSADGEELIVFDFCLDKTTGTLEATNSCQGETCFINEYVCNHRGNVVEFVHECSLGCIEDFCIGTKCEKNEIFVINDRSYFLYDNCEIHLIDGEPLDIPSIRFDTPSDYQCCSGSAESYCVYDGKCYASSKVSNFYEFDGEIVACGCTESDCSLSDGNHIGLWYDLDTSIDLCVGSGGSCNVAWYPDTGFRWIPPGVEKTQEENVWEYENQRPECCGDDSGEYIICNGEDCICCDRQDLENVGGKCVEITDPPLVQEPKKPITLPKETQPEPEDADSFVISKNLIFVSIVMVIIIIIVLLFLLKTSNTSTEKSKKKK